MNEEKLNSLLSQIDELQQIVQTQQELILYLMKDIQELKAQLIKTVQTNEKDSL
ncbi:hypothetical protein QNI16_07365 [Cytophagaceae bacterium YF14B1]|uniref:SlyX protein n=1 Tax=Xanthocytophaga flava TaxID=3048013 RepID=A0AAE3QMZ1_9BACT|nr:hypothetical protein [Xanthocytophaga flavus]MDJ1480298.1 hypothetical protein [Xanthocytophaga flavus]